MTPLPLFDRIRRERTATDADLARVISALAGRGWRKREDVARELQLSIRKVRAIAEASHGQIVGGNQGLALTCEIPGPEAERCARRLESQGRAMLQRAVQIRRAMHSTQKAA